jgi:hypothetical protein
MTLSAADTTQNPHTQVNELAVTAKIPPQPAIQPCDICSCSNMANRLSWAAWKASLCCSMFRSHLNTDYTFDSPEIWKIFMLSYSKPATHVLDRWYNAVWILVCSSTNLYPILSSFSYLIFFVCRSFLTSSSYLFFCHPIGLEANGFHL